MKITELLPAMELQCWSKLGLAVKQAYAPGTKQGYYQAPSKAGMAKSGDLTKFGALVLFNNPEKQLITLQAYALTDGTMAPSGIAYGQECLLHYTYFKRIRLISAIAYPPRPNSTQFPTQQTPLDPTATLSYKTTTEVILSW